MPFPVPLKPADLERAQRLNVRAEDITEQFTRGGGAGGQKINKTSSTVVLRHLPTGTEVRCQQYREQSLNRLAAYKMLLHKIEEQKTWNQSQRAKRIFKIKKQKQRRSRKMKERMLKNKKIRGMIKENRRVISG